MSDLDRNPQRSLIVKALSIAGAVIVIGATLTKACGGKQANPPVVSQGPDAGALPDRQARESQAAAPKASPNSNPKASTPGADMSVAEQQAEVLRGAKERAGVDELRRLYREVEILKAQVAVLKDMQQERHENWLKKNKIFDEQQKARDEAQRVMLDQTKAKASSLRTMSDDEFMRSVRRCLKAGTKK